MSTLIVRVRCAVAALPQEEFTWADVQRAMGIEGDTSGARGAFYRMNELGEIADTGKRLERACQGGQARVYRRCAALHRTRTLHEAQAAEILQRLALVWGAGRQRSGDAAAD